MGFLDFLRSVVCPKPQPPKDVIQIPNISDVVEGNLVEVEPISVLRNYGYEDVVKADKTYYALPKKKWIKLLTRIYDNVNPLLEYNLESLDCDDYSTIYASLVALTFYLNRKTSKHQLAFGIAWSKTHAFNLFVDDKERVWIYEPQTNEVVNEIHKVRRDMYKARKVWFMG